MRLLLDTTVLIKLCHPRNHPEVKAWLQAWLALAQVHYDIQVVVSAAAEYEARRGYLWKLEKHADEPKALARLDQLVGLLGVQGVSEAVLREASRLWADAKLNGYSTAPDRDFDWDVIIAAQAKEEPAVVVSSNGQHISRYGVDARDWDAISPPVTGGQSEGGAKPEREG